MIWVLAGAPLFLLRWAGQLRALVAPARAAGPSFDLPAAAAAEQLTGHVAVAAVAALAVAGTALPGAAVARVARFRMREPAAMLPRVGLGLTVVALASLGTGLAGLAFRGLGAAIAGPLCVGGLAVAVRWARTRRLPPVAAAAAVVALASLVPAVAPEREVDALVYHLALPEGWRAGHRILPRPDLSTAGFPLEQETLGLLALLLGSEPAAKLVSWCAAVLTALCAVTLALPLVGESAGWFTGAAVLASPQLFERAADAKSDALAAFLAGAAVVAGSRRGAAAVLVTGLLAGSAVATKSTAALAIPALWAFQLVRGARPVSSAMLLAAGAAVPVLPWLFRNAVDLGNPVSPLLMAVWPAPGRSAVNAELIWRYAGAWQDVHPANALQRLRDLVRILGGFNPLVAAGVVAAIPRWRAFRRAPELGVFAAAYLLLWFPTPVWLSRFLLPAVGPLTVVAALVVARGGDSRPAAGPAVAGVLGLACCLGGVAWSGRPGSCAVGLESRPAYAARVLGGWTEVARAVRDATGPRGRALSVGEFRSYPTGGRLLAQLAMDTPAPWALAEEADDERRLALRLKQRRLTHLLYNLPQAAYWADYAMSFPWTSRSLALWSAYWDRHATLVWRSPSVAPDSGAFLLYRLDPGPTAAPFRAWLPGAAGEFAHLRLLMSDRPDRMRVEEETRRLDASPLGPRAETLARTAMIAARFGRWEDAAAGFAAAARAAPEAAPVWSDWGGVPVPPAGWADSTERRRVLTAAFGRSPSFAAMLFNLGIPLAVVVADGPAPVDILKRR